ncbi:hypothetical protein Drose_28500 [Dactylosporangium roseum]|uniref:Uncharacterized protein n=1 Tax=Dactylosporangium roseum TaxID=47989 RepID=A0ABY5Z2U8_9ACTN|nr:hypothetical protein [Dactylosporangium roseum]UWZ35073.1 hypothetical protein Drose_28500 [Dactylosporangium roseum]
MDDDDVTRDGLPRFLDLEHDDTDSSAAEPEPQRSPTVLLASGGVALLLVIGLVVAALLSGGEEPARSPSPAARRATGPVVPTVSAPPSPEASPTPSPSPGSARPSRTRNSPTPTRTASTTPPATTTSASVRLSPASYEGPCLFGSESPVATVTIRVSRPGTRVAYSVGGREFTGTAQGTTYSRDVKVQIPRRSGSHTVALNVSAPSTASGSATFVVKCR